MSNALIFYKSQDPSIQSNTLSDKEKKAYDSFFKPLSIAQFKDNVKRSRSTFIDPKDKNVLPGWTKKLVVDFVLFPLVSETIIGEVKEVKGTINETLKVFFNFKEQAEVKENPQGGQKDGGEEPQSPEAAGTEPSLSANAKII